MSEYRMIFALTDLRRKTNLTNTRGWLMNHVATCPLSLLLPVTVGFVSCNGKETPVFISNGCVRASMCVALALKVRLYVNFQIHSTV